MPVKVWGNQYGHGVQFWGRELTMLNTVKELGKFKTYDEAFHHIVQEGLKHEHTKVIRRFRKREAARSRRKS